ncbi:alpha/beta hydrolase [Rhodobacteraceae bacterium F11138]|nr:alpha/beta hydrolase [Rhodobacteraceae bacterium F11138]
MLDFSQGIFLHKIQFRRFHMRESNQAEQDDLRLGYYDLGPTPFFTLQSEPRLCYCLYVPTEYQRDGDKRYPLIVLIHGTERWPAHYRDNYAAFAQEQQAIVLAPLFPCNLFFIGDTENYKLLKAGDIRFDQVLLDMVDEIGQRYRLASDKFLMHGFSGGGHFTHRFLYAHPHRLLGASIGAPGVVTLCEPDLDYPLGLKGMADFIGGEINPDGIAAVPIQCVVGAEDTDTWEITIPDSETLFWVPGINDTGITRIDRLRTLAGSLEKAGCDVQFDMVPGLDHDQDGVVDAVQGFFARILQAEAQQ